MKIDAKCEPFIPKMRLFHDAESCKAWCKRKFGGFPELADSDAQTFRIGYVSVILMEHRGDGGPWENALLVHEAYHVVCQNLEAMMEESPGDEVFAYMLQEVSGLLMQAHAEWRSRHVG